MREKEFRIAEKAATYAESMEDSQLLSKIDKVWLTTPRLRYFPKEGLNPAHRVPWRVNKTVSNYATFWDWRLAVIDKRPRTFFEHLRTR